MNENREKFLYLDFNGKIPGDVFEKEFFLRIANLNKRNPLVQVNDVVFKGTYDHAIGTNLFFDVEENTEPEGLFKRTAPLKAKMLLKETKTINLKSVKVPPKRIDITNELKNVKFNLNMDYKTLLEQLEKGTIRLEDMVSDQEDPGEVRPSNPEKELPVTKQMSEMQVEDIEQPGTPTAELHKTTHTAEEKHSAREFMTGLQTTEEIGTNELNSQRNQENIEKLKPVEILEAEYKKLKVLAGRPTKRAVEPELVEECDPKYKEAYEYHNIERQILQPCDAFKAEPVTDIEEDTLSNCVDVDRCVLYGIISPSTSFPRKLKPYERKKVLRLDNFDNLALCARYCVIKDQVLFLEKHTSNLSKNELEVVDRFGRTPIETLELFRKLEGALQRRIQEIKYALYEG